MPLRAASVTVQPRRAESNALINSGKSCARILAAATFSVIG